MRHRIQTTFLGDYIARRKSIQVCVRCILGHTKCMTAALYLARMYRRCSRCTLSGLSSSDTGQAHKNRKKRYLRWRSLLLRCKSGSSSDPSRTDTCQLRTRCKTTTRSSVGPFRAHKRRSQSSRQRGRRSLSRTSRTTTVPLRCTCPRRNRCTLWRWSTRNFPPGSSNNSMRPNYCCTCPHRKSCKRSAP